MAIFLKNVEKGDSKILIFVVEWGYSTEEYFIRERNVWRYMTFNIEITKERLGELFKNESQEAVGKKLNMTQGNVSKLLTGKQQPTVDGIDKELPMVTHVGIGDEILQSILYEWKTMLPSQDDIYQMWMDKRLKEYSEIDYISWDEEVKKLFYECRPLQGVSYEFLKAFCSAHKEKKCQ